MQNFCKNFSALFYMQPRLKQKFTSFENFLNVKLLQNFSFHMPISLEIYPSPDPPCPQKILWMLI